MDLFFYTTKKAVGDHPAHGLFYSLLEAHGRTPPAIKIKTTPIGGDKILHSMSHYSHHFHCLFTLAQHPNILYFTNLKPQIIRNSPKKKPWVFPPTALISRYKLQSIHGHTSPSIIKIKAHPGLIVYHFFHHHFLKILLYMIY